MMGERHSGYQRSSADFYVEEPWASGALFAAEQFVGAVYDPACGTGNIVESARAAGLFARGTDLVDRGWGHEFFDFLDAPLIVTENVVTNPPFTLSEQFIVQALNITTAKVAILARVSFLASLRRRPLFEATPLSRVLIFSDRIKLYPDGKYVGDSPSADHCWLIWRHGHAGPPTIGWLSRDR